MAAYEIGDAAVADRHVALARSTRRPGADTGRVDVPPLRRVVAARRQGALRRGAGSGRRRARRDAPLPAGSSPASPGPACGSRPASSSGGPTTRWPPSTIWRSTPYAASGHWWRAWALARGGRPDDVGADLRAFDGPLADDWYRAPLLCAALHAAAIVGDVEFAARWVDVLRPLQDHVAVAGSGGLVLGPIALAVARADVVLGDPAAARRSLDRARGIARRMDSPPWLAQIAAVGR